MTNEEQAREVAYNFYQWLIDHGYRNEEDFEEDINDICDDFVVIQKEIPRMLHLLRDISDIGWHK